jgi:Acetyltransferase (GNAT) domain
MTQAYRIRSMTRDELGIALDWAAAEGWNPGLHDAACFHAADPEGFLVGLLDGEPVATISVVRYAMDCGLLGFYIDAGIADKLFAALIANVEAGATIALDTPEANPWALELAQRYGMTAVFETARMYTGSAPAMPMERVYGVTSYELG